MTVLTQDLFSDLGAGDHQGAQTIVRNRMKDFYYAVADLTSAGITEEAYEEFLFPFDTEADQTQFADGMWSCALTVLGKWRQMGVRHPYLEMPYRKRIGRAISDVKEIARQFKALCDGNKLGGYELRQGDVLVVGEGNNLHATLIADVVVNELGQTELDIVEGGRGSKGQMAIRRASYLLEDQRGRLVARNVERKVGRPVAFAVDLWALVFEANLLAA